MKTFICALLLSLLSASAAAQVRSLPADAQYALLSRGSMAGWMKLNEDEVRVSPGVQIRDKDNSFVGPSSIRPNTPVKYKMDGQYLFRVWILTPQEAKGIDKPDPAFAPFNAGQ